MCRLLPLDWKGDVARGTKPAIGAVAKHAWIVFVFLAFVSALLHTYFMYHDVHTTRMEHEIETVRIDLEWDEKLSVVSRAILCFSS